MLLRILRASIFLLITVPVHAFQIDMEAVFPNVAQGHRGNNNNICHKNGSYRPQLQINNDAKISGTKGEKLDFCSSNTGAGLPTDSCDDGQGGWKSCEITNQDIRGVHNNGYNKFLTSSRSAIEKDYCNSKEKISYEGSANKNLGKFTLYATCTLELNAKGSDYKVKSLEMGSGAKLILHAGDYWFESLSLKQTAQVEIVGDVRVFIKNNTEFNSAKFGSADSPAQLIFSYGNFHLTGTSEVNALVYSDEKIIINNNSVINGRVTAKKLEMDTNAAINEAAQGGVVDKCFDDNFNRNELGGDTWAVNSSRGAFTPKLENNRFRLTTADTQQATSVTYLKEFPTKNNDFEIEFDHYAYDGNGADGVALVLSDITSQVIPGSYGGPLGYGSRKSNDINGFNGGWLGIGIDEYGNFVREGGGNSRARTRNTVAIRGAGKGTEGYDLLAHYTDANTPIHSDNDANRPHRYRVRINFKNSSAQAQVTISRRTIKNGEYKVLIDEAINQTGYPVPEKLRFSITGSTGSSTSIHEIDNTRICAKYINDIPPPAIDHFRFDIKEATAQSCGVQKVELIACIDEDCDKNYNESISATLATSLGMSWRGGNKLEFPGSKTFDLEGASGSIDLDINSSDPQAKPYSKPQCQIAGKGFSTNNCKLEYSGDGEVLNFTINHDYVYAGAVATATLAPQKKCQALYQNVEKEVSFTAIGEDPQKTEHRPDLSLVIDGKKHTLKQSTADTQNTLSETVKFDEQGKLEVGLHYSEAGKTKITASIDTLTGADSLITIPKGLCVKSEGICAAADASCDPFVAAGQPFDLTVTAHGLPLKNNDICSEPALQNYIQKVTLSANLLAPKSGADGQLDIDSYTHNEAGSEAVTAGENLLKQSIDEVGVFSITAKPSDNYHGIDAEKIAEGTSEPIGRFYPAYFELKSGEVVSANSGYPQQSYMGQPFKLGFTVSAVNADGVTTENYKADFVHSAIKLDVLAGEANKNSRVIPLPSPQSWDDGKNSFSSNGIKFSRNGLDGPYDLDFKLTLSDKDRSNVAQFDDTRGSNSSYSCGENCEANTLILGKQTVRHGLIPAISVSGPINEPLSVPLRTEYWDSEQDDWQDFELDSWTDLKMLSNVSFPDHGYDHPTLYKDPMYTNAGLAQGTATDTNESAVMEVGRVSLNVTAPNTATQIRYQLKLADYPWLKPPNNAANEGLIQFGGSLGNRSVIYRREQLRAN